MAKMSLACFPIAFCIAPLVGAVAASAQAQELSASSALRLLVYSREDDPARQGRPADIGPVDALGVFDGFRSFIQSQTSTFPTGSSSAGFSYTYDPKAEDWILNTRSFGPLFAERALTGGAGRWGLTLNWQSVKWEALSGRSLDRQAIRFLSVRSSGNELLWSTDLNLRTTSVLVGATYGVTNRLDIGVTVPFNRTSVKGTSDVRNVDNEVIDDCRPSDTFPSQTARCSRSLSGSSSGVGDVSVRAKYQVIRRTWLQASALLDVRLPTGNADELLGTGKTQIRTAGIWSVDRAPVAPHGLLSFTKAGRGVSVGPYGSERFGPTVLVRTESGWTMEANRSVAADSEQVTANYDVDLSNELGYAFGLDWPASKYLTVAGDVVGRVLFDSARLETARFGTPIRGTRSFQPFLVPVRRLHLPLAILGAKVAIMSDWVITANVLFPLNDAGLRASPTPVVGIERVFRSGKERRATDAASSR